MKRYEPEVNSQYGDMDEDPEGRYVRYEDAKELLDALEFVKENLKYNKGKGLGISAIRKITTILDKFKA